jgi:hypothetical protein
MVCGTLPPGGLRISPQIREAHYCSGGWPNTRKALNKKKTIIYFMSYRGSGA